MNIFSGAYGVRSVSNDLYFIARSVSSGFLPEAKFLGMSKDNNNISAPGLPFILGFSERDFFDKAAARGWITTDTLLNTPAAFLTRTDLSIRSIVEPFPGLKIDINADRRFQENINSYYRADYNGNFPDSTRNKVINGSFSISIISWGTAFEKITKDNDYVSRTFENFKKNSIIISERRAAERQKIDPGYDPEIDPVTGEQLEGLYKNGYGATSRKSLSQLSMQLIQRLTLVRSISPPFPRHSE